MTKYLIIILSILFFSCNNTNEIETKEIDSPTKNEVIKKIEVREQKTSSQVIYTLNDISVELSQSKGDGSDFYCSSKLITKKNEVLIDSVVFNNIDPVGSDFGISKAYRYKNYLIFNKYGDYDGRTIIINNKGIIKEFIGGDNYIDVEKDLLFAIYVSDLKGFAIFDLKKDSFLFEMKNLDKYPLSVHKEYGERYFVIMEDDKTDTKSIWEIELDLERIMHVDLNFDDINSENKLKEISILGRTNCICETNSIKQELLIDTFVSKGNQIILIAPTGNELKEILKSDTSAEYSAYDDFSFYANKVASEYEDTELLVVLPTENVIEIIAFDSTKSYLNKNTIKGKYGFILNSDKREPIVEFGIFTGEYLIEKVNL